MSAFMRESVAYASGIAMNHVSDLFETINSKTALFFC